MRINNIEIFKNKSTTVKAPTTNLHMYRREGHYI